MRRRRFRRSSIWIQPRPWSLTGMPLAHWEHHLKKVAPLYMNNGLVVPTKQVSREETPPESDREGRARNEREQEHGSSKVGNRALGPWQHDPVSVEPERRVGRPPYGFHQVPVQHLRIRKRRDGNPQVVAKRTLARRHGVDSFVDRQIVRIQVSELDQVAYVVARTHERGDTAEHDGAEPASVAVGCNDPVVQACVCAIEPFCCSVGWDSNCVHAAPTCL